MFHTHFKIKKIKKKNCVLPYDRSDHSMGSLSGLLLCRHAIYFIIMRYTRICQEDCILFIDDHNIQQSAMPRINPINQQLIYNWSHLVVLRTTQKMYVYCVRYKIQTGIGVDVEMLNVKGSAFYYNGISFLLFIKRRHSQTEIQRSLFVFRVSTSIHIQS